MAHSTPLSAAAAQHTSSEDRLAQAHAALDAGDVEIAARLISEDAAESEVLSSAAALLEGASRHGNEVLWCLYQELAARLGSPDALRNYALKVGCWLGHIAANTPGSGPCGRHIVNATLLEVIPCALAKARVQLAGDVELHLIGCTLEREPHLDLHKLRALLKRRVAPEIARLKVVMVGFFEDYSNGRRLTAGEDTSADEAWRTAHREKLRLISFEDSEVSLECYHGCYHDLELTTPNAAVLCNPGLEVHFASWAPTIRNLVQRAAPVVLVGSCAFQDVSCFDAAVSEPVLRWLGARILVSSTCSPFPVLHMDMRLIALKGRETSGIPFRASDGFFCIFAGQDTSFCLDGMVPDGAAAVLRCFVECVCRLEMLRDELLEPGESEVVPLALAEEPPQRAAIRSFFARDMNEVQEAADSSAGRLPCTAEGWLHLFKELSMWPSESEDTEDAAWKELFARFWKRRSELGAHRLQEEALALLANARKAAMDIGTPVPSGPAYEALDLLLEVPSTR